MPAGIKFSYSLSLFCLLNRVLDWREAHEEGKEVSYLKKKKCVSVGHIVKGNS